SGRAAARDQVLVAESAGAAAGESGGGHADAISDDDPPAARSHPAASAARRRGSGLLARRLFLRRLRLVFEPVAELAEIEHARLVLGPEVVAQALARAE